MIDCIINDALIFVICRVDIKKRNWRIADPTAASVTRAGLRFITYEKEIGVVHKVRQAHGGGSKTV